MWSMEPRELMRRKEAGYRELALANESLTREHLIRAMVEHPRLLERPIVMLGQRAVLGRPTEKLLELIQSSHSRDLVLGRKDLTGHPGLLGDAQSRSCPHLFCAAGDHERNITPRGRGCLLRRKSWIQRSMTC